MYLSDLRVYFKLQLYFRVTEVGWRSTKIAEKTSGLCQHYQRWIYCWLEGLFHGWLIYSYLQMFKLIKCKWLPGECADWFLDNIMKDSILTNEHALNREPVPLNAGYHRERSTKLSKLSSCQPSPAYDVCWWHGHIIYADVDVNSIQLNLNHDLVNLNKCFISNKLTLNTAKTEFMLIGSRQKLSTLSSPLELSVDIMFR